MNLFETMRDYNFETLNSKDFEQLVQDLLDADARAKGLGLNFLSFPEGKDRGVDLIDSNSKPGNYNIVVQVKHQPNIGFQALLTALTRSTKSHKSEIEKIKKLAPERYIFATSKSLTLANREEIMGAMKPYIPSVKDILDKEVLNHMLSVHPEVELRHSKLWFSSVRVFERILHNDIHGRSEQLAEDIRQKLRMYIPVNDIEQAMDILRSTQFLVIIGEPGCGKTTFAEIILHKLAGMSFTAYWIDKSVSEIEGQLKDDESSQVFYFDDFLGHTRYEIEMGRTQEKGLLHFLRRVTRQPNKYFILTTRTSLINAAAADSEKFRTSSLFKKKQEMSIRHLSEDNRIRMINNHLDVKEVDAAYASILTEENIRSIARHSNFSPRLIEFVTTACNYHETSPSKYHEYILKQLENPHEVWLHAYEQQLDDCDRFLLTTLFSFRDAVTESQLEKAFENRLKYEINHNNILRTSGAFRRSFKKLLGSFITFKQYYEGERLEMINPSLEDFLYYYLNDNKTEKLRIVNSFLYAEQIFHRFRSAGPDRLIIQPEDIFRKRLESDPILTIAKLEMHQVPSHISLYRAILCRMFFKDAEAEEFILKSLTPVDWPKLGYINFFYLLTFLKASEELPKVRAFIVANFSSITITLVETTQQLERLEEIKLLFEDFGQSYTQFIQNEGNLQKVKARIDSFFEDEVFDIMESNYETVRSLDDIGSIREGIEEAIVEQYEIMEIEAPANMHGFDDADWVNICATNDFNYHMEKRDYEKGPIRKDD